MTVFILIILPPVFWKHINFGGNFFQYFVSPLPIHVSAMGDFHNYLQAVGSSRPVIEWLIPFKMGDYTNTLGFCVIIFFYFFLNFNKFLKAKLPLFCIFLLISTIFMFGQKSPRFFLDSIIWLLLLFEIINLKLDLNKYFKLIFASQILILSLAMIFSVFSLTSGTLSKNLKDQVLKKNADGYTLFKWSNSKLKKDESIISYHRSIYFSEVNTMAVDLLRYIPDIKRARENGDFSDEIYWQEFQSKKPKYLLTYGEDPYLEGIENCIGDLVHYKKDVGAHATRNPINRSNNYYNGYLFEFNYQELPACAFNE